MSVEAHLAALTEALNKNTEALLKITGTTGAAAAPAATGKEKTKTKTESTVTQDQMNAAIIKVKDDFGLPVAKEIIKEFGKVEKMSEIKPANYQAVHDAAVKKHAELSAGKGEKTDDDDI